MDFMIGTVDTVRLREDLLRLYRSRKNLKSPTTKNAIYTAQEADEQQIIALAKKEGMDIRKYIR